MDGFLASALAAFFGGALSFLSPCVLPLVPGYLCFAAGLQFSELSELDAKGEATRRILPGALAFVGGFSAVFIALGAGASAINPLLLSYQAELGQIAGAAIIILGLHVGGVIRIPFLAREARLDSRRIEQSSAPLIAAFIMGLAFAFGWTPCIGPILATILALAAARESMGEGVSLLAFYAAGLGLPFILAALGVGKFMAASQRIKQNMVWVERGAGGLLVITGGLIMFGSLQALASYLLDWFPFMSKLG
ncbi:MAG: cytochrome c biogenesis CcdA family protein [Parvibaculales bacterium]